MSLGPELKASIISGLRSKDIGYQTKDDGTLCVSLADAQRVWVVMSESVQILIPSETSQSMDEEVHRRVVNRLMDGDIPFTEQQMDGHNYLVWNSAHDAQVRQIIDAEFTKFFTEELNQ